MSTICGVKLTHDGAVALIKDRVLMFSIEAEKLGNAKRYSAVPSIDWIFETLEREGVDGWRNADFVVDGWKNGKVDAPVHLKVGAYHEGEPEHDPGFHRPVRRSGGPLGVSYTSYTHNEGHIYAAYCTSPFAKRREAADVLVWDGGQGPRLYHVNSSGHASFTGTLFDLNGSLYSIMSLYWGPYKVPGVPECVERAMLGEEEFVPIYSGYDTPGKLMSYMALAGEPRRDLVNLCRNAYRESLKHYSVAHTGEQEHRFCWALRRMLSVPFAPVRDEEVLLAIHTFLQQMLLTQLAIASLGHNLCFTGGSALNIKWNSAIRASGIYRGVWVPPFPNDSGNAIGAACAHMVAKGEGTVLDDWSVFSGPDLPATTGPAPPGWWKRGASIQDVARILHTEGEPVVFMSGRAELGPRALGARSILAPATGGGMKGRLNGMKGREEFRPVAPICMEEHAPSLFTPGTPDPYMLFDHRASEACKVRFPAIVHLDGTARLQTVPSRPFTAQRELLEAYYALSGNPLLCNTSANLNGSGFFPDAESAMRWGGTMYVWVEGVLFTKERAER